MIRVFLDIHFWANSVDPDQTAPLHCLQLSFIMRTCLREFPTRSDSNWFCSATEASMRLEILVTETRDITLSRQQTRKALIRLRRWSAPFLFAYDIRHVFSWPGSILSVSFRHMTVWSNHIEPSTGAWIVQNFEPCHEKTCLSGFWPGTTQTGLLSYRD